MNGRVIVMGLRVVEASLSSKSLDSVIQARMGKAREVGVAIH